MYRTLIRARAGLILVGGLAAIAAGEARAEFITYTTTVALTPGSGFVGGPTGAGTSESLTTAGGTTVILTGNSGGTASSPIDATTGTNIILGSISVPTTAATPHETVSFGLTYTLTINDYGSATGGPLLGTRTVTITGTDSGTIGAGMAVMLNDLTSYTTSPASFSVGGFSYAVQTIGPGLTGAYYTPPGATASGTFGALVTANTVPEPSAFALAGVGLLLAFAPALRRHARRLAGAGPA